jgi:site-specific recombinase XerD
MYAQYLVVENDIPLKIAQRLLGHRNLNNLEFYINLRTTDLKEGLKKVEQSVESKRDKE